MCTRVRVRSEVVIMMVVRIFDFSHFKFLPFTLGAIGLVQKVVEYLKKTISIACIDISFAKVLLKSN